MPRRILLLLASFWLSGCRTCPAPKPPPPPVLLRCQLPPAPVEDPVLLERAASSPACPAQFAGCLDALNAVRLDNNLDRLRAYVRDAQTSCGPHAAPTDAGDGSASSVGSASHGASPAAVPTESADH